MICCICSLEKKENYNALIPCKITIRVKDKKGRTRYRKVKKNICRKCLSKSILIGIPVTIVCENEE